MRPIHHPDPVGAQMRSARREAGWSLTVAEQKVGIPGVVLGSWERGDRHPPLHQLRRWVEAFDRQLVILEPDQRVISTNAAGEEWLSYVVVYGPAMDGLVECDSQEEAANIASRMPGAQVGHRINRRGQLRLGGTA